MLAAYSEGTGSRRFLLLVQSPVKVLKHFNLNPASSFLARVRTKKRE